MEAIFAIIVEYIVILAPSLIAILGTVGTILKCMSALKESTDKLKNDPTIREMREELRNMAAENKELAYTNKLLLDEITKIQGYVDAKRKEEG